MARRLIVEIVGDNSKLEKSFQQSSRHAARFGDSITRVGASIGQLVKGTLVVGGVTKAVQGLSSAIGASVDEWKQQQQAAAQTVAVIKSTGAAAGVTAGQVDKLAAAISGYSGMDDEAVQAGENMLLTFTQIRNVAGKNNDIFNQATKVTADLSTAMGIDMSRAALQVGKALNDPARGYARLQRIGVAFTKTQIAQIKHFTATGNVMAAQRIILAELNKEFGGSAKAAGDTLPGQLNKLRESFRNVGGDIIGSIAPALTGALDGLNNFVKRLSEAKTTRAKLTVVWEGIEAAGRALFNLLRNAVTSAIDGLRNIDWGNVGEFVRNLATRIGDAIQSVDWAAVIRRGAQLWSTAFVTELNALRNLINRVDWQALGRRLVDGIVIAVAALVQFLRNVDWKAVITAIVKLLVAAVRAQQQLFLGIGKEFGRVLLQGLKLGIQAIGRELEQIGIQIVLNIIKPFTYLAGPVAGKLGDWARDLQSDLIVKLHEITVAAHQGGQEIPAAVADGITEGSKKTKAAVVKIPTPTVAGGAAPPGGEGGEAGVLKKAREKAARLTQLRNQWFDALIGRRLDIASDLPLRAQLKAYEDIANLIVDRINATKDITRRLMLEGQLRGVIRQAKGTQDEMRQVLSDALDARVEAAKKLKEKAAKAAAAAVTARTARQFRQLGLGPTGEALIPTGRQLLKRLGTIESAVTGTVLDTRANRSLIDRIRDTIVGGLGRLAPEVRQKMKDLMDALVPTEDQKRKADPVNWIKIGGVKEALAPAGTEAWIRQVLRANRASVSTAPIPAAKPGLNVGTMNVHLHGVQNVTGLENELSKRTGQRVQPRRGV